MTTIHLAAVRRTLEGERERLIYQLAELGSTESGDLVTDLEFGDGFADAAAATSERTEVLGLVDNVRLELSAVDAALARIADGTYGICAKCARQIPVARLEARPQSVLCVDCKSKS
jgi:DnaK suppressor protein